MDGEKACKTLPDHLVERIIAMIPFPAIFQARCLSKSWRARFSSIASQDDEAMKCTASLFQNLVSERAKNWETFCPVLIATNGDLIAYDKKTDNWQKMPSVSFLPKELLENLDMQTCMQIDGALLHSSHPIREDMYVANILTRTWKQLPFPPILGCPANTSKLVVTDRSLGTYKVVLLSQRELYEIDFAFLQIYDPKLDLWSCIKLDFEWTHGPHDSSANLNSVFFGDIFYCLTNWRKLFAFDVRQGTVKKLELQLQSSNTINARWDTIYKDWEVDYFLVVCEEELLMVFCRDTHDISPVVLRIDLDSLTLTAWNSDAPFLASLGLFSIGATAPVGGKDHIFFGYHGDHGKPSRIRAYNVKEHLWSVSDVPPTRSVDCQYNWTASFQPGFGPFAAV